MIDLYVYPGTNTLKNNFNIKDPVVLEKLEANYTSLCIRELQENPIKGNYDFEHYCNIHKYIFYDIFEWAGTPRTIPIEKEEPALGGLSIEYTKPEEIEKEAVRVLDEMRSRPWEEMSLQEQTKCLTEDMANIWKVHPFREGNTRTAVIFSCDFMESKGIPLDRSLFEKNSAYMRNSLVAFNAIFSDLGNLSKPEYLQKIVGDSLERGLMNNPNSLAAQRHIKNRRDRNKGRDLER